MVAFMGLVLIVGGFFVAPEFMLSLVILGAMFFFFGFWMTVGFIIAPFVSVAAWAYVTAKRRIARGNAGR